MKYKVIIEYELEAESKDEAIRILSENEDEILTTAFKIKEIEASGGEELT